jgi:multicomponent Na+:H+ antiporter subunit D
MIEGDATTAWALTALVFAPVLAALVVWFLPGYRPLRALPPALGAALILMLWPLTRQVSEAGLLIIGLGGRSAPLAIEWYLDGLALVMLWLTQVVCTAVGAYLWGWVAHPKHRLSAGFPVCWLLLWGALNALFLSADLFNIYVLLEIVSLGGVVLVVAGGGAALTAAMRYLLFALLGSIVYLLGVAMTYADTGTLSLRLLLGAGPGALAAALITVGLLFKAAIFPLHGWLPRAHAAAPAPASAVLSALVVKAAAYLVLRLWSGAFVSLWTPMLLQVLAALGAAGVVYASVQALRQERLKRLIAYSTVAQLSYVLMLPVLAGAMAWQGMALHLVSHGLAKAAMFLAAGNVLLALRNDRIDNLARLDRILSGNLLVIAAAGLSLAGMPPAGGFVAKWWLLNAALQTGQWWWGVAIVAGGLLAAAYMIRVLRAGLSSPDSYSDAPLHRARELSPIMVWSPAVLAVGAVAIGLAAAWFGPLSLQGSIWAALP